MGTAIKKRFYRGCKSGRRCLPPAFPVKLVLISDRCRDGGGEGEKHNSHKGGDTKNKKEGAEDSCARLMFLC